MTIWLDRTALIATLLLPAFLMHGRAVADVLIGVIDLCFLVRCATLRDWAWLRTSWVMVAAAWWGWLVLCSVPGIGIGGTPSLLQAAAVLRFLLLVAALENAVLREAAWRRWLSWVLAASAVYIGAQSLLQFATGRDLQGYGRGSDGELTGPFEHARAAAPLSRLLFPALLPPVARLVGRGDWTGRLAAGALTALGVGTVLLIGQRMPLLLVLFGLVVCGLMLRRLRAVVAVGVLVIALMVPASAVVSPPAFHRLVTKFTAQMEDFPDSPYGLIATRALAIATQNPLFGRGYDGFRNACPDPRYFLPSAFAQNHMADGGGAGICNIHPHNHYLEAIDESGVPGLAMFTWMVALWLAGLLRGLGRNPPPLRVGLFVAALIQEWPIASASSFTAMEIGGFFFLLLGWGLAEARADSPYVAVSPAPPPPAPRRRRLRRTAA